MAGGSGNLEECRKKGHAGKVSTVCVFKDGRCVTREFPCGPEVKIGLISLLCAHFLFIRVLKNFNPCEE